MNECLQLIVPKFLEEGKKISDENLLLVNQLVKKAKAEEKPPKTDPEVQRFFKWIIERFENQVTKHKGNNAFLITVFIAYDEVDEHINAYEVFNGEKIAKFVVGKKGYLEAHTVVNETFEMLRLLKNFKFDNRDKVVNNYLCTISYISMYLL
ncbi:MAG: hypothetical protein IJE05_05365 [Clostridia bacterium]|nr:hypothetical protein [Clostridia bacterium]